MCFNSTLHYDYYSATCWFTAQPANGIHKVATSKAKRISVAPYSH